MPRCPVCCCCVVVGTAEAEPSLVEGEVCSVAGVLG